MCDTLLLIDRQGFSRTNTGATHRAQDLRRHRRLGDVARDRRVAHNRPNIRPDVVLAQENALRRGAGPFRAVVDLHREIIISVVEGIQRRAADDSVLFRIRRCIVRRCPLISLPADRIHVIESSTVARMRAPSDRLHTQNLRRQQGKCPITDTNQIGVVRAVVAKAAAKEEQRNAATTKSC